MHQTWSNFQMQDWSNDSLCPALIGIPSPCTHVGSECGATGEELQKPPSSQRQDCTGKGQDSRRMKEERRAYHPPGESRERSGNWGQWGLHEGWCWKGRGWDTGQVSGRKGKSEQERRAGWGCSHTGNMRRSHLTRAEGRQKGCGVKELFLGQSDTRDLLLILQTIWLWLRISMANAAQWWALSRATVILCKDNKKPIGKYSECCIRHSQKVNLTYLLGLALITGEHDGGCKPLLQHSYCPVACTKRLTQQLSVMELLSCART